eukprot:TRINITY_DN11470_c1_g1_i2.p1 TRINITY_DN11470_c1_g1~~TRINITY_DN11470_c1_g1_i2.p1  ORF type:complete len:1515 (+),score=366.11 TRINITY_DN11470_c1_g1_i2:83-4546(+)
MLPALACATLSSIPTASVVQQLRSELASLIPSGRAIGPLGDRADSIGVLTRLAFHDAGTWGGSDSSCADAAGPDGCIMLSLGAHGGLPGILPSVNQICNRYPVSRADCWQYAGTVALEEGLPDDAAVDFRFVWGRRDSDECSSDDGRLPSAEAGNAHVMGIFQHRMGLKPSHVTALNGAHVVGRAASRFGGYPGIDGVPEASWVSNPAVFDNSLYKELLEGDWRPQRSSDGQRRMFIENATGRLALLTDVTFIFDVDLGSADMCYPTAGPVPADASRCPMLLSGDTRAWAEMFARDREAFYAVFVEGWVAMQGFGYTGLRPACNETEECVDTTRLVCENGSPPVTPSSPTAQNSSSDGCSRPSMLPAPSGGTYACSVDTGMDQAVLHWKDRETTVEFAFSVLARGWVSVAFPQRVGRMGPSRGLIGWAGADTDVQPYDVLTSVVVQSDAAGADLGVVSVACEEIGGRTVLRFELAACGKGIATGKGCVNTEAGIPLNVAFHPSADYLAPHTPTTRASIVVNLVSGSVTLNTADLDSDRRMHGALMLAGWLFLAPVGAFMKRYGRRVFGMTVASNRGGSGELALAVLHVLPVLAATGLSFASFGICAKNWWTVGKVGSPTNGHSQVGVAIFFLSMLQPVSGVVGVLVVPRFNHPRRRVFHALHGNVGHVLLALGAAECILGVAHYRQYSDNRDFERAALVAAAFWVAAFGAAEVLKRFFVTRRLQPSRSACHQAFVVSVDHVKMHSLPDDCWVIVNSKVYDVTEWVPDHPGGSQLITDHAGQDASQVFHLAQHSEGAWEKLYSCYCADLEDVRADNSVRLAHFVTNALAVMRLEEAQALIVRALEGDDLPDAFCTSLLRLVSNLRMYRDFLPASLLTLGDTRTLVNHSVQPPIGDVCMVFTDIVGSTPLWEASSASMDQAMDVHNLAMRQTMAANRGYEVKMIGDAFMVAFADPASACSFGAEVMEQLDREQWPHDDDIDWVPHYQRLEHDGKVVFAGGVRVRIGIHYGQADHEHNEITGRVDYRGSTVIVAARLESVATPGMVLVSEAVVGAVEKSGRSVRYSFKKFGQKKLKGVKQEVQVHYVFSQFLQAREAFYLSEGFTDVKKKEYPGSFASGNPLRVHTAAQGSGTAYGSAAGLHDASLCVTPTSAIRKFSRAHPDSRVSDPTGDGFDSMPVDNRLQSRMQSSLLGVPGTVGVFEMVSLPDAASLQAAEVMTRCCAVLGKLHEFAGRTGGKLTGLASADVTATWNVVSSCPSHALRGQTYSDMISAAGVAGLLGLASGLTLHGHLGHGRSRFLGVLGPGADLARLALKTCRTFGVNHLSVFLPRTPPALLHCLRPIDVWGFGGQIVTVEQKCKPLHLQSEKMSCGTGSCSDSDTDSTDTTSTDSGPHRTSLQGYRTAFLAAARGDQESVDYVMALSNTSDDSVLEVVVQLLEGYAETGRGYRTLVAGAPAATALQRSEMPRDPVAQPSPCVETPRTPFALARF